MRYASTLAQPIVAHEIEVRVGGSVGIADDQDPGVDVLGLVEQADRDMYRAKRARDGRCRAGAARSHAPARVLVARPPTWSMSVQGSSSWPAAGWPGVHWSASPGRGSDGSRGRGGRRSRLDTR